MSENSKLTAQQQALVEQVLKNLEEGAVDNSQGNRQKKEKIVDKKFK